MAYDDRRKDYSKEHIYVVDIRMDYCSLFYSESPCQAELGTTGERFCYNTFQTCQDRDNYDREEKVYRHVTAASNLPDGLNMAQPDILPGGVTLSPTEIDIGGGLGRRASITIRFQDHPGSDIGIDKYVLDRIIGTADADGESFNPVERGTYWGKFRARNPFYQNRFIEVYSGYIQDGTFDLDNFQKRTYVIEDIAGPTADGTVTLTAKDPLKLTNIDRAQAPTPSIGQLAASLSDTATSFDLNAGPEDDYPASGKVRIGDEIMDYTRSGTTFAVTRGTDGTEATEHDALDSVQLCLVYETTTVADVLFDLLTNFADIPTEFINKAEWDTESAENFPFPVNTVISEPVGVEDLLIELAESAPHQLWWDERENEIRFQAIKAPTGAEFELNDFDNFIADSVRITDAPDKRISQVWFWFGQADRTDSLDEKRNYRQFFVRANLGRESINQYRGRRIKTVFSRWINAANRDFAVNSAALLGRRFGRVPRIAEFSLEAKDNSLWAGDQVVIRHRNLQSPDGSPEPLTFQVISVAERDLYRYKAMQVLFDPALPVDDQPNIFNLQIVDGVNDLNVNLRTLFEENIGDPPDDAIVNFTVPEGVVVGSTSVSQPAIDTGLWPSGVELNLIVEGIVAGKGGAGGAGGNAQLSASSPWGFAMAGASGGSGGIALMARSSINIDNSGSMWGGGGGGGGGGGVMHWAQGSNTSDIYLGVIGGSGGGSGSGKPLSVAGGAGVFSIDGTIATRDFESNGASGSTATLESGGSGGGRITAPAFFTMYSGAGGAGGGPGENGQSGEGSLLNPDPGEPREVGSQLIGGLMAGGGAGGSAGPAIDGVSLVTFVNKGDVRGPEIN